MNKTYFELCKLPTFEERFEYLQIKGVVGKETFGFDRYLNQNFYRSKEWRRVRRDVILRDDGCDLGVKEYKIFGRIIVHHINPISSEDITNYNPCLLDMNNLICVSENTDRAIHYGEISLLYNLPKERKKGDTVLWRAFSKQ